MTVEDLHFVQVATRSVVRYREVRRVRPGSCQVVREESPSVNAAVPARPPAHRYRGACAPRATELSLASDQTFLSDLVEILVVQIVGQRDVSVIPADPVICLVTTQQNNRRAAWVETEQRTEISADRAKLLHVVVPRRFD